MLSEVFKLLLPPRASGANVTLELPRDERVVASSDCGVHFQRLVLLALAPTWGARRCKTVEKRLAKVLRALHVAGKDMHSAERLASFFDDVSLHVCKEVAQALHPVADSGGGASSGGSSLGLGESRRPTALTEPNFESRVSAKSFPALGQALSGPGVTPSEVDDFFDALCACFARIDLDFLLSFDSAASEPAPPGAAGDASEAVRVPPACLTRTWIAYARVVQTCVQRMLESAAAL
jgi:hypothetical protein